MLWEDGLSETCAAGCVLQVSTGDAQLLLGEVHQLTHKLSTLIHIYASYNCLLTYMYMYMLFSKLF